MGKKITQLATITEIADDDLLVGVDISDTSGSDGGTNKRFTKANLLKELTDALVDYATLVGEETIQNKTLIDSIINGDNNTISNIHPSSIKGGLDGWTPVLEGWSYASPNTITVPSGATSRHKKGDKIRFTQTTVKYGFITNVADTLLTIAVNTDYTVASAEITLPSFSREESPMGYPAYFNTTSGEKIIPSNGKVRRIKDVAVVSNGTAGGFATIYTFGTSFSSVLSATTSGARKDSTGQVPAKVMALVDSVGNSSCRVVIQSGDGTNIASGTYNVLCDVLGVI